MAVTTSINHHSQNPLRKLCAKIKRYLQRLLGISILNDRIKKLEEIEARLTHSETNLRNLNPFVEELNFRQSNAETNLRNLNPFVDDLNFRQTNAETNLRNLNPVVENLQNGHLIIEAIQKDLATLKVNHISQLISSLVERMCLLESQINWRLLGMPAKIENIKLELAAVLAAGPDIGAQVDRLAALVPYPDINDLDCILPKTSGPSSKAMIFGSNHPTETKSLYQFCKGHECKSIVLVRDTTNLFQEKWATEITIDSDQDLLIEMSLTSAASYFVRPEFELIWLSNILERMTPLQASILLRRASMALQKNAWVGGYFQDAGFADEGLYWCDPRRVRPLTKESVSILLESAGLSRVHFEEIKGERGWVAFGIQG